RDESLVGLATTPGLGPPDLCWLQKASKGSWATVNAEPRGFWHHTLGRDVSSSAAVAAYFAELNATVEPITFMQGLWYTAETKIERGFYCCYEPFNRLDVRCELCIPGGVVCGALDAEGTVHQVTPDIWRNCQLAAFLRHQLYDPELTQHAGTLRRFNPLPTAEAEQRLFDIVDEMYSTKLLPRALEYITQDAGLGSTAEHMDIVLFTVFHYLGRQHRWKVALAFFERLSKVYVGASLYVAAAQRELEGFDDSFATLSSALERTPSDAALLVALANECLYAQQAVLSASYGILQELVAAVGWDSFLQMRARVFVMHERTGGKKKTDMEQVGLSVISLKLPTHPRHRVRSALPSSCTPSAQFQDMA
ncbi:Chs5p-Arf1p-binding proteins-domain-containing protein, partial [Haematococcus lacustris]